MDRIFLNMKTGKIIISLENGMIYEDDEWKQIGTISVKELFKTLGASQKESFRGLVKIS